MSWQARVAERLKKTEARTERQRNAIDEKMARERPERVLRRVWRDFREYRRILTNSRSYQARTRQLYIVLGAMTGLLISAPTHTPPLLWAAGGGLLGFLIYRIRRRAKLERDRQNRRY